MLFLCTLKSDRCKQTRVEQTSGQRCSTSGGTEAGGAQQPCMEYGFNMMDRIVQMEEGLSSLNSN